MFFINRILNFMLYPGARTIVTAQSEYQRFRTLGKSPKIHFEEAYDGQPIMLLALYQKGRLRPDLIRLIKTARAQGIYVLGVNTLKLKQPEELRGLVDCYIERPNFGRDFGSYKTGFLHLFTRRWEGTCPRLLMLNDSVFYSEKRLPKFLEDMMTSDIEVLGSTENFDIEHHMGSFCIAIGSVVLRHKLFKKYWKNYRLTDVRPTVIKHGELKLSKVLKRCVTGLDQFVALYSASRYIEAIKTDRELMDFAIANVRTSKIFAWKRASLKNVAVEFRDRYAIRKEDPGAFTKGVEVSSHEYFEEVYLENFDALYTYIKDVLKAEDINIYDLHNLVVAELGEGFLSGSQVHQNACILLETGLPFVKNDGLYRGIFSLEDINRISTFIEPDEASELLALLVSRPYGGRYLTGWKRAAFEAGLI
ncbi:rhamnan synthesis F family protein [Seohaeicola sp.]|uniref:rhamnan synthesis F family protein n=1 Tax=Seohaeicola sp. TaxID=2042026 RepID=UPI003A855390